MSALVGFCINENSFIPYISVENDIELDKLEYVLYNYYFSPDDILTLCTSGDVDTLCSEEIDSNEFPRPILSKLFSNITMENTYKCKYAYNLDNLLKYFQIFKEKYLYLYKDKEKAWYVFAKQENDIIYHKIEWNKYIFNNQK